MHDYEDVWKFPLCFPFLKIHHVFVSVAQGASLLFPLCHFRYDIVITVLGLTCKWWCVSWAVATKSEGRLAALSVILYASFWLLLDQHMHPHCGPYCKISLQCNILLILNEVLWAFQLLILMECTVKCVQENVIMPYWVPSLNLREADELFKASYMLLMMICHTYSLEPVVPGSISNALEGSLWIKAAHHHFQLNLLSLCLCFYLLLRSHEIWPTVLHCIIGRLIFFLNCVNLRGTTITENRWVCDCYEIITFAPSPSQMDSRGRTHSFSSCFPPPQRSVTLNSVFINVRDYLGHNGGVLCRGNIE